MAGQSRNRSKKGGTEEKTPPTSRASSVKSGPVSRILGVPLLSVFAVIYFVYTWLQRGTDAPAQAATRVPALYGFRVVREYPHDPKAFTQGLLWLNGSLYESTGLYGRSSVREVRLEDGKVLRQADNKKSDFGEGLVHWKGELLQLLWRVSDVVHYSFKSGPGGHLKRKSARSKTPFSDGWGLETDGESLLVTDNGPDIFFLDPDTFRERRRIRVNDGGRVVEMVNELEVIDGEIWGNVFGPECLARISPETGEVRSWVLLDGLLRRDVANAEAKAAGRDPPDVLNGIAWDPEGKRLFVTGKLWPTLFEIELVPADGVTLEEARKRCIPPTNIFRDR